MLIEWNLLQMDTTKSIVLLRYTSVKNMNLISQTWNYTSLNTRNIYFLRLTDNDNTRSEGIAATVIYCCLCRYRQQHH